MPTLTIVGTCPFWSKTDLKDAFGPPKAPKLSAIFYYPMQGIYRKKTPSLPTDTSFPNTIRPFPCILKPKPNRLFLFLIPSHGISPKPFQQQQAFNSCPQGIFWGPVLSK